MSNQTLTLKDKIGFAFLNLGNIPITSIINTYLLIFYTDIAGIDPKVIGTLFLVARFLDAIGDPVVGFLVDHFPATKYGKYRMLLFFGSILTVLNFGLLWAGPILFPEHKVLIVYVTYLLFGIIFDLMDIPLNSLIPMMSKNGTDRTILSSIKGVSFSAGSVFLNTITPLLIANFPGITGYKYMIVSVMGLILVFNMLGILLVKEQPIVQSKKVHYGWKQLWDVLKIRRVFCLFLTMFCSSLALFLYQSSIIFYVTYVLNNVKVLSIANSFGVVGAVLGGLFVPFLASKYGKTKVYTTVVSILIGVLFFQSLNAEVVLIFVSISFIRQTSVSMLTILQYSLAADNVQYVLDIKHISSAGAIAALNSLAMKLSMGVAGMIQGFILASSGYVSNQVQTPEANWGIMLLCFILPVIFYASALILFRLGFQETKVMKPQISVFKKTS